MIIIFKIYTINDQFSRSSFDRSRISSIFLYMCLISIHIKMFSSFLLLLSFFVSFFPSLSTNICISYKDFFLWGAEAVLFFVASRVCTRDDECKSRFGRSTALDLLFCLLSHRIISYTHHGNIFFSIYIWEEKKNRKKSILSKMILKTYYDVFENLWW